MDNNITGLNNPRQLVLWAYREDRAVGDVSEVFDLEGQFVVAVLITKAEEGFPPMIDVRTRLNTYVYNDLKGKIILDEMKALGNDFQTIAQSGQFKMDEMASLTFSSRNIKGYGSENEIIGTVFGLNEGDNFGPEEGKGGIFVVEVNKITRTSDQDSYLDIVNKLQNNFQTRINQGTLYTALENASDIEDNRLLFF